MTRNNELNSDLMIVQTFIIEYVREQRRSDTYDHQFRWRTLLYEQQIRPKANHIAVAIF